MANNWKCPICGEEIDSVGPATLQLEVSGHNKVFHPGIATVIPKSGSPESKGVGWTCTCGEYLWRSNEAQLELAKVGHQRTVHGMVDTRRYEAQPWGGWTAFDRFFLDGNKIVW